MKFTQQHSAWIADMLDFDDVPHPADDPDFMRIEMGSPQPHAEGFPGDVTLETGGETPPDRAEDDMCQIMPPVIQACAAEPQNDTGNGARLLKHFGEGLLHVREIGWHEWNGTHWRREGGDEAAVKRAQRTAPRIALEADYITATKTEQKRIAVGDDAQDALDAMMPRKSEWNDEDKRKARGLMIAIDNGKSAREQIQKRQIGRRKFAVSSGNASRIRGMLDLALPDRSVSPDVLDGDPMLFNVENGTIIFERAHDVWIAKLREHKRTDHITKVAPVAHDEKAKCPAFNAFMRRFQPNENVRRFLQTYHGYALTGLVSEQCVVFNHGLGANGKSTFIETIARVMGPYCRTLQFESLTDVGFGRRGDQATPDVARLPGARLVRASEPRRNVHFDEAMIKSMTGGEPMLVRHLQKGFFEFRPIFKLVLSGNQKPEIGGVDHGIWRRMRLVPWPVTIPDGERRPIEDVLAEFWNERAGILNWLIEGTLIYLNDGLTVPQEILDATGDYKDEMDPVGNFVSGCVSVAKGQFVTARSMHEAFVSWCEANSVRAWREKSFALAMSQKGFVKRRMNNVRRYVDVSLHDVPSSPIRSRDSESPHPGDEELP